MKRCGFCELLQWKGTKMTHNEELQVCKYWRNGRLLGCSRGFDFKNTTFLVQQVLGAVRHSTGCPTRYRTWHFFNNSKTNEDIATKQTHSSSFLTQQIYSCLNFFAISSLC
jgi:hypothetical protein